MVDTYTASLQSSKHSPRSYQGILLYDWDGSNLVLGCITDSSSRVCTRDIIPGMNGELQTFGSAELPSSTWSTAMWTSENKLTRKTTRKK
jgi:hypothetical protein